MTIVKNTKYLMQKNDDALNIVLPRDLKKMVVKEAKKLKINNSQYTKLALIEKMERDQPSHSE